MDVSDFGVTLPTCIGRAMSPLQSAELFAPPPQDRLGEWNLVRHQARTASSMLNTLTKLSRSHAQILSVLNFVRFDQALYLFGKKVVYEKLPCQNFVCDTQIQIPHLFGGFLYDAFPLAYDYTCTASFLVRVLRHNMHHIDLSDLQAGLPGSCAYPYIPDCSARE